MYFLIWINPIKLVIIWHITVPNAAPAIPPKIKSFGFIFTNVKFIASFASTPHNIPTSGIKFFPRPCNVPIIVCYTVKNTKDKLLICSINAPELALGNNIFNIGFANAKIPAQQGKPIKIFTRIENDTLLLILL